MNKNLSIIKIFALVIMITMLFSMLAFAEAESTEKNSISISANTNIEQDTLCVAQADNDPYDMYATEEEIAAKEGTTSKKYSVQIAGVILVLLVIYWVYKKVKYRRK